MTEQLELIKNQSRYKTILSTLFNTSVGSLSFLLAMLMASIIALVILVCFFNVMLFISAILIIVIMCFLSVLAGSALIIVGGVLLFYTNWFSILKSIMLWKVSWRNLTNIQYVFWFRISLRMANGCASVLTRELWFERVLFRGCISRIIRCTCVGTWIINRWIH